MLLEHQIGRMRTRSMGVPPIRMAGTAMVAAVGHFVNIQD